MRLRDIFILGILIFGVFAYPKQLCLDPFDFKSNLNHEEISCLAKNVYYEANNQSKEGQLAVAAVTLNRTKSEKFPKKICDVVYQRVNRACQFSWTCQKDLEDIKPETLVRLNKLAANFIKGIEHSPVGNTTMYYHADYVKRTKTAWFRHNLKKETQIGNHIFYAEK